MKLGPFTIKAIDAGMLRVDGGAMFGVVPKALWNRPNPADEENRIRMMMRVLYVEGNGHRLVIDSGAGTKLGEKTKQIYAMQPVDLRWALEKQGVDPDSITDAILTHLHFDHAGGFSFRASDGALRLSLPNAKHYVQRAQWAAARTPSERDRSSFSADDLLPIEREGELELLDGQVSLIRGVSVLPTQGHTPGHQMVLIETDAGKVLYCADLIPLTSHVNPRWIMAYDELPLSTLKEKRHVLSRAADEGWILVFEHDPHVPAALVRRTAEEGFEVSKHVDLGASA